MRNIWLIIRREVASYLRTPSAYIIAAAILLVNGIIFNAISVGDEPRFSSDVLQNFLLNAAGMTMVAAVLFSMRLLAEERASGTQVLLFTSPIREEEIVVGKYLSALLFLTVLILMSLYLPALIFVHGKVSWGHIAAGYFGMILIGAAVLALGVFASSLVKNPFLGVLLAAVFAAVSELCWYGARVTDPPLKETIQYFSPISKHFEGSFMIGIVQLSDVVFFLSVIYLSLFASVRVLKSQRWQ